MDNEELKQRAKNCDMTVKEYERHWDFYGLAPDTKVVDSRYPESTERSK
jgi:hypothetical protein